MAHSVSRSQLCAGLFAAALMAAGSPAFAKAKKKTTDSSGEATGSGSSDDKKPAEGAAQQGDVERPKPTINSDAAEAPKADAEGNVSFAGAKTGKGKITVKAPTTDKEKPKVYLEGRYFGLAPRTINRIPPGDYIVEVVFPNGKSVTKPVSVSGDEETVVQIGAAESEIQAPAAKPMSQAEIDKRWGIAKLLVLGSGAAIVLGLGLGYWEHTVQNDYNTKAATPVPDDAAAATARRQALDDLSNKGNHLALAANGAFVLAGLGLVAAVIVGYPAYKANKSEQPQVVSPEGKVSFMFLPGRDLRSGSAGLGFNF